GMTSREACIHGAGEIALAITMSTLTTIVVFLPVALVEGNAQFFFLRMALPISVALLASLLVALVFVPLSVFSTLTDRGAPRGRTPWYRPWNAFVGFVALAYNASFRRLRRAYVSVLGFFLVRRLDLILALLLVFAVTGAASVARISFVDVQDDERSGFEINVEMAPDSTLEETESWFLAAEHVVETHAGELDLAGWVLFHRKDSGAIQGWFNNPRTSSLSPREVTQRVKKMLPPSPGSHLFTGDENQTEEARGEDLFVATLYGEDPDQLDEVANNLEPVLAAVDGVLGVKRGFERTPSELGLIVDRQRAERLGVNPRIVAGVVGYALRGTPLPRYVDDGREVPVRVRFREDDRKSVDELANFLVPTGAGSMVPLSSVTSTRMLADPGVIVRRDKRVTRTVTLELEDGEEEEARVRIAALIERIDLPEGVSFGARPTNPFDEDLSNLQFAGLLSVVFIYLLMGFLFESFILPLSIILTIPLASIGVIWIHILAGRNIDFLGAVGIVLLIGVVVNNGIVLIDYVNRLRAAGTDRTTALLDAADRRFRPIMMTAITTIGGLLPLAFAGRTSLGFSYTSFSLALIGGMTTATLLTLLVVPVFYTLFDDLRV
ncbi:MAG: efflux RND transporter permease subunit, partial [Acidobacteriota bacterium]